MKSATKTSLKKHASTRTITKNLSDGFINHSARLGKILAKGNRNEDETRRWVIDVLKSAFGYSDEHIETELKALGKRVDIAIVVNKKVLLVIECKAANIKLKQQAVNQVANYATSLGAEWAAVTNGQVWSLFHVTPINGSEPEIVELFEVQLFDEDGISKDDIADLYLMTEKALVSGETLSRYHFNAATDPERIMNIIVSDQVINTITKELQKQYKKEKGVLVDEITSDYIKELVGIYLGFDDDEDE